MLRALTRPQHSHNIDKRRPEGIWFAYSTQIKMGVYKYGQAFPGSSFSPVYSTGMAGRGEEGPVRVAGQGAIIYEWGGTLFSRLGGACASSSGNVIGVGWP